VLEVGGGRALYSRPGSPLNKVLGLGLSGPVSEADLDRLVLFYEERASPAQVELSPLAHADVAPRLCARGFVLQSFENQIAIRLPAGDLPDVADITVVPTSPEEDEVWLDLAAEGFAAGEPHVGGAASSEGPAPGADVLRDIMSSFLTPEIRRTVAWVDGRPAGAAASWLSEGVIGIFGTATVPAFRRRGVQTALTAEILEDAGPYAEIATATVAPGSTSQRTFERLGFRIMYTRAILVRPA
jgi:ribosomal protein S18 acetylase RimI-like enzyme